MKRCLLSRGLLTRWRGFTLVEMLVVIGIIVILIGLVTPAIKGLRGSGDFTASTGGMASILEQARSYAMANNTYVYVGIGEFDAAEPSTASPRTAGVGQVAVVAVAARDGTRGYDVTQPTGSWASSYQNGAPLLALDKVRFYDNLHLADLGDTPPATGNMNRPAVDKAYRVGNPASVSQTPLAWPLGQGLTGGQYTFKSVIQFDPQGVARIQSATNADTIAPWIEIGLQPSQGNIAPALPADQNKGNQGAILVDCMTGSVRIYRP